jgi:hypothetical protein
VRPGLVLELLVAELLLLVLELEQMWLQIVLQLELVPHLY